MLFLAPTILALLLSLPAPATEASRVATPRSDAVLQETLQNHDGAAKRYDKGACEGKAKRGAEAQPTSAT